MNVYLVRTSISYEDSYVAGVFSTSTAAHALMQQIESELQTGTSSILIKRCGCGYADTVWVEEMEVEE